MVSADRPEDKPGLLREELVCSLGGLKAEILM